MNGTLGNDGLNSKKKKNSRYGSLSFSLSLILGLGPPGPGPWCQRSGTIVLGWPKLRAITLRSVYCLSGGVDGYLYGARPMNLHVWHRLLRLKRKKKKTKKSKTRQNKAKGSYVHAWYPSHVFYPRSRLDRIGSREMVLCNLYHHHSLLSLSLFFFLFFFLIERR